MLRLRLRPKGAIKLAAKPEPCAVAVEACCRQSRCRGDCRSGHKSNDAVCRIDEPGASRHANIALLESPTPLGGWLRCLMARMHTNAAVVALANTLAHMAWAMPRHEEIFNIDVSTTA